jgi:hypothetical protein
MIGRLVSGKSPAPRTEIHYTHHQMRIRKRANTYFRMQGQMIITTSSSVLGYFCIGAKSMFAIESNSIENTISKGANIALLIVRIQSQENSCAIHLPKTICYGFIERAQLVPGCSRWVPVIPALIQRTAGEHTSKPDSEAQ